MRKSKKQLLKRVVLTATAFLMPFLFQNCAAPDVASSSKIASLSITPPQLNPAVAMSATYAPQVALVSSPVTLTGVGGVPPYTYSLFKGTGTLTGNVYVTAATGEDATIMVRDSSNLVVTIAISSSDPSTAGGGGSGADSGGNGAAPTPIPTPIVIAPSNALQVNVPNMGVLGRSCDLPGVAADTQNAPDADAQTYDYVDYVYCLVLLRHASRDEIHAWADPILNGDIDPDSVVYGLYSRSEFATKYNISSMTPNDYLLFLSRLLLMTDPSAEQMSSVVGDGTLLTKSQQDQYDAVVASDYFKQANPICPAAEQAWRDAMN